MPHSWHRTLASLALVVFALQSYVTQTHIHFLGLGLPAGAITTAYKAPPSGKQNPFDNPQTCPVCQDLALVGHFTTPAAIAVLPPVFLAVAPAVLPRLAIVVPAPSHSWQSRAPPRH